MPVEFQLRKIWMPLGMTLALACAPSPPARAQQSPATQTLTAAPEKLSLDQAMQIANQRNLDLVAARAQLAVSAAGITTAKERPNLTGNFNALRDDPHEGWWFDVPLELGSKRSRRIDLAQQEGKLTADDVTALERLTRQNVRDAFFTLALSRGVTLEKNNALALAQRLQSIAETRFAAGDVPELEVEQAKLGTAQAQADLQMAQQQEKVALSGLNALLDEPPQTDWHLVTPLATLPPETPLSNLLARAGDSNPQLQRIAQQETIEQSNRALLRADRIPNLTLSLGMDYNSPHNFRYGPRSQVSMEVPIFSRNQGEIAASSASLIALQDQAAAARRTIEGHVESAYFELDARESQARLYQSSLVPTAENLESMAEESYQAGKANILYVLDAQANVQQVKLAYLQSLFTVQQAFAQLEETVGAPLD